MIDLDKLPSSVANDIAENLNVDWGNDADVERLKRWLENATVEQAFNRYLTWNGFVGGWAHQLIRALDGIRAASGEDDRK